MQIKSGEEFFGIGIEMDGSEEVIKCSFIQYVDPEQLAQNFYEVFEGSQQIDCIIESEGREVFADSSKVLRDHERIHNGEI